MNSKSEIIRKLKINEVVARKIRLLLIHDDWASLLPANPRKDYPEDWLRGVGENADQLIKLSKNYVAVIDPSEIESSLPAEPLSEVFNPLALEVLSHLKSKADLGHGSQDTGVIEEICKKLEEFSALAGKLDGWLTVAKETSEENERQAREIASLTAENENLTSKNDGLETALVSIDNKNREEVIKLNKTIREKDKETKRLNDELQVLETEKNELVRENKSFLTFKDHFQRENEDLMEQLKRSKQNETIESQKRQLAELTAENEKLKTDLFPAIKSTNQNFSELLLNIVKNSSPELQEVKNFDEVAQVTTSWTVDDCPNFWNLISQVNEVNQLFQVAERELEEKNDQLTEFEEQIFRLNEELKEKDTLQMKMQQEGKEKENELTDLLVKASEQFDILKQENSELKDKNYELQDEVEELQQKNEIEGSHLLSVQHELEMVKSPAGNATPIPLMGGGFLGNELKVVEQSEEIAQLREKLVEGQAKLKRNEDIRGLQDFGEQLKEVNFSHFFDSRRSSYISYDDSLISGSTEARESRRVLKEELAKKDKLIGELNNLLSERGEEVRRLREKKSQSSASKKSEDNVPSSPGMRITIPKRSSSDSLRGKVFVDSPLEMDRKELDLRTDLEQTRLENDNLRAENGKLKEENEKLKADSQPKAENSATGSENRALMGAEWQAILENNLIQQAINIRYLKRENEWLTSRFEDYLGRRAEKDALAPATVSFDAIYQSWLPGETETENESGRQEKFERYNRELGLTKKIERDISKIKEYLGSLAEQIEQAELNWQELWKNLPKTILENDYQAVAGQAIEAVLNEEEDFVDDAELAKQYGISVDMFEVASKAVSVLRSEEEWEIKVKAQQIEAGFNPTTLIELATKSNEINSKFIQQEIEDLDEESSSLLQERLEEIIANNEKKIAEQQQEYEEADNKAQAFVSSINRKVVEKKVSSSAKKTKKSTKKSDDELENFKQQAKKWKETAEELRTKLERSKATKRELELAKVNFQQLKDQATKNEAEKADLKAQLAKLMGNEQQKEKEKEKEKEKAVEDYNQSRKDLIDYWKKLSGKHFINKDEFKDLQEKCRFFLTKAEEAKIVVDEYYRLLNEEIKKRAIEFDEIQKIRENFSKLYKEFAEQRKKQKELETAVGKNEVDNLKQESEKQENLLQEVKRKNSMISKEKKAKEEELERVTERLTKAEKKVDELTSRESENQAKIAGLERELNDKNLELDKAAPEKQVEIERLLAEKGQLEAANNQLESEISAVKGEKLAMTQSLTEAETKASGLESQLADYKSKLEAAEKNRENLAEEIVGYVAEKEQFEQWKKNEEEIVKKSQDLANEKAQELEQTQQLVGELKGKITDLEASSVKQDKSLLMVESMRQDEERNYQALQKSFNFLRREMTKQQGVLNDLFSRLEVSAPPPVKSKSDKKSWFAPQRWLTNCELDWFKKRMVDNAKYKILNAHQLHYVIEKGNSGEAEAHLAFPNLVNDLNEGRELVFIPVNRANSHWSLLVYENATRNFYHYDTLNGSNDGYVRPWVEKILRAKGMGNEWEKHLISQYDIQQGNGHDCGVAVIAITQRIIQNGGIEGVELTDLNNNFTPDREKWQTTHQQELENENAIGEAKETLNQIKEAKEKVEKLKEEMDKLKGELEEKNDYQQKYQVERETVNSLTGRNAKLGSDNASLERQINSEQTKKNQIEAEKRKIEEELGRVSGRLRELEDDYKNLENDWNGERGKNTMLTSEKARLEAELSSLNGRFVKLGADYQRLSDKKLETQEEQSQELRQQLEELQKENGRLEYANSEMSRQLYEKESEIDQKVLDLEIIERELKKLKEAKEDRENQLTEKDQQLEAIQSQLDAKEKELKEELDEKDAELKEVYQWLEVKNQRIIKTVNEHKKEIRESGRRLAEMHDNYLQKSEELALLTHGINTGQKNGKMVSIQARIKELEQAVRMAAQALELLVDKDKVRILEINSLKRRITGLIKTAKNYRGQIKTNSEVNNLTKKHLRVKSLSNLPDLPQNANGTNNLSLKQLISGFENLQNQLQTAKTRADTEKARADATNAMIAQAQTTLGIADLNNLPTMPSGKTLADLIVAFATPAPNCSHSDYDSIKTERDTYRQQRDHYQNQLATHTCPVNNCQEPCCQGGYERLQQKLTTQEKVMLGEINNSLELELESEKLTLKIVIGKIEELIRNPLTEKKELQKQLTETKKMIKLLKKQLAEKDPDYAAIQQAEYQNLLQLVKEDTCRSCEKLGISIPESIKEQIEQAETLEAVMKERNKLIGSRLAKSGAELKMLTQQKDKLSAGRSQERWIWGSLLMVSYLVIIGLVAKLKRRIKK